MYAGEINSDPDDDYSANDPFRYLHESSRSNQEQLGHVGKSKPINGVKSTRFERNEDDDSWIDSDENVGEYQVNENVWRDDSVGKGQKDDDIGKVQKDGGIGKGQKDGGIRKVQKDGDVGKGHKYSDIEKGQKDGVILKGQKYGDVGKSQNDDGIGKEQKDADILRSSLKSPINAQTLPQHNDSNISKNVNISRNVSGKNQKVELSK